MPPTIPRVVDHHRRPDRRRARATGVGVPATQTTPLAPTRRDTQSSPLRSPPTTGREPDPTGVNRSAGVAIVQGLVGPLGVVVVDPLVQGLLGDRRASGTRGRSGTPRAGVRWNRSILPVVVGDRGCGEQVLDPVLPADPVEEHLDRRVVEPAGEHLAVVGQDLLGDPVACASPPPARHRPRWVRSRGISRAETQNREWSSTPVSALAVRPVGQHEPAHDVHLPQLHRRAALPPLPRSGAPPAAPGVDQARPGPAPDRPPDSRRQRRHARPGQLDHDPPRTPRRMQPTHLQHPDLDHGRHLMRTRPRPVRPIRQPLQTAGLVPASHACSVCRDTPTRPRPPMTVTAIARSPPAPPDTAAPPRSSPSSRECQGSAEAAVKHQPKHCQASTEARTSSIRPKQHTNAVGLSVLG